MRWRGCVLTWFCSTWFLLAFHPLRDRMFQRWTSIPTPTPPLNPMLFNYLLHGWGMSRIWIRHIEAAHDFAMNWNCFLAIGIDFCISQQARHITTYVCVCVCVCVCGSFQDNFRIPYAIKLCFQPQISFLEIAHTNFVSSIRYRPYQPLI